MLRQVINKHVKPRIVPFQITTDTAGATMTIGAGDFTVSRASAGVGVLTHRHGFSRNGMFLACQSTTAGGYATYNTSAGASAAFNYSILDNGGSAVDGSAEGFCFGWDNSEVAITKAQRVACTRNDPRILWGKIAGAGTVSIGTNSFTCTKTDTGVYAIRFISPFAQTPVVMVTGSIAAATANSPMLSAKTAAGVTVTMAPRNGTPVDRDFYICAIGQDSRNDGGRNRDPLQNNQRRPRIIACEVTNTTGTPTMTIGGATGGADFSSTITDNSNGDFTITMNEKFAREPAIFLCTTTQGAQVHTYSQANGTIRFVTLAANATATDVNGVTHVFVIGSDVNEEF